TGVQTCALPIYTGAADADKMDATYATHLRHADNSKWCGLLMIHKLWPTFMDSGLAHRSQRLTTVSVACGYAACCALLRICSRNSGRVNNSWSKFTNGVTCCNWVCGNNRAAFTRTNSLAFAV